MSHPSSIPTVTIAAAIRQQLANAQDDDKHRKEAIQDAMDSLAYHLFPGEAPESFREAAGLVEFVDSDPN